MKKLLVFTLLMAWMISPAAALDRGDAESSAPPEIFEPNDYTVTDTLIGENFDEIAVGDVPVDWVTEDLTASTDPPFWHLDTYHAMSGSYAWWCGDDDVTWVNPPGYGNDWHQYLILDLDLTAEGGFLGMTFNHRYEAEFAQPDSSFDTWDGMNVQASVDGGATWTVVDPYSPVHPYEAIYAFHLKAVTDTLPGYSGPLQDWTQAQYDLSAYAGAPVKIAWVFASDSYASDEDGLGGYDSDGAWFIDDIDVFRYPTMETIYSDDCESGQGAEWTAVAGIPNAAGDYWEVIDTANQPQPDGYDVFYSTPNGLYCGDKESSRLDGTYTPGDHGNTKIQNSLTLPTLDCTEYTNVKMKFWERYSGDGAGGYGYIDVSYNGGANWLELEHNTFLGRSDWTEHHQINLMAAGKPSVTVRFLTQSGTGGYDHWVYWYLDDLVISGEREVGIEGGTPPVSTGLALAQNRPNPFNPHTRIDFNTSESGNVRLAVFDLSGREVAVLVDGSLDAGAHSVTWNGATTAGGSAASGIYVYTLETAGRKFSNKMVLLK